MDARLDLLRIPDMAHGALAYINERNPLWKQWQTERVRGAFTAAVECTMIEEGSYGRPQVYAPHKETVFLNGHKIGFRKEFPSTERCLGNPQTY